MQHQDTLARCHILAGQGEGAIDHGGHRAADGAVFDVDDLLRQLGLQVGGLELQRVDLGVDHVKTRAVGQCLMQAALGLLVFRLRLHQLALELRRRCRRLLERPLVGNVTIVQRPVALEFETGQFEIRLQRRQRLLLHRHAGPSRTHYRLGLLRDHAAFGGQPRALGLDALDLCRQRIAAQLGDTVVDPHDNVVGAHPRAFQRRHLDDPAFGPARHGNDVGRHAGVVFIDMRKPQIDLAAGIQGSDREHRQPGQDTRAQEEAPTRAWRRRRRSGALQQRRTDGLIQYLPSLPGAMNCHKRTLGQKYLFDHSTRRS